MPDLLCYGRTVFHLKLRQIAYQIIRLLGHKTKVSPITERVAIEESVILNQPIRRLMQGDKNTFTFLNVTQTFDLNQFDWSPMEVGKLWRYNLHYFDYLHEVGRCWENKVFLINDWIKKNPQGTFDAWEPFPISLRIVNWIKFFLSSETKGKLEERWLKSLYQQTLWLKKNLEYHLLGNHYFKNGKALIFAGLFFTGKDAQQWLEKGLAIIREELDEQIMSDGGHFERSPMYHSMILEDCMDLMNLCAGHNDRRVAGLSEYLKPVTTRMLSFLLNLTHPDGQIALFNDAAFGIEAVPKELQDYYERLTAEVLPDERMTIQSFPDTGYFIMSPREGDKLIVDCGDVSPNYQPGHSHCDNLSFELSLRGKRIIVDSGCCQYEDGEIRQYNRGNAGHNTLTIDGINQSEVWGAHRCARRAHPLYAELKEETGGVLSFKGAHDGYRRLVGKPIHYRNITWSEKTLVIEDRVEGKGSHDFELRLHINPDLNVLSKGTGITLMDDEKVVANISLSNGSQWQISSGWYCPEFGIKRACPVVTVFFNKASLPFKNELVIETER
ncbi:MAG: alginate lyase family protein [Proteobacteria bacterium]|nr:alginate lyase family protein [Pseudomonadota bacterium]